MIKKLKTLSKEIDYTSPIIIFEKLYSGCFSALLESAKFTHHTGRYSFICISPFLVFKSKNNNIEILKRQNTNWIRIRKKVKNSFYELKKILNGYQVEKNIYPIPFIGGAVGFISYDMWYFFEKYKRRVIDDLNIPDLYFAFYETVVALDNKEKRGWIISNDEDRRSAFEKIKEIEKKINGKYLPIKNKISIPKNKETKIPIKSTFTKSEFERVVRKCKEYIAAGDIYQANLSIRLEIPFKGNTWHLYKILREINPSPFSSYLEFDNFRIVSCSPERLIRLNNGIVDTRPIAGTRPRGNTKLSDIKLKAELLLNEKEQAEHIMLVDLERNDIGRVCSYGTVVVDELMTIEDYSHVFHIVSNVKGCLHHKKDRFSLIRAVFPGGTITGCPKIRCMQIIDELEPTSRNTYTGSIGYLSFCGNLDLNIVIRTFLIKNNKAYIQVGAGIVYDSDPEREYYECLYKAEALLCAIEKLQNKKIDLKIKKFKPE